MANKPAKQVGATMVFRSPSANIWRTTQLTGLDKVFVFEE